MKRRTPLIFAVAVLFPWISEARSSDEKSLWSLQQSLASGARIRNFALTIN